MRNLLNYPITYAETKATFENLADSVSYEKTGRIGDTQHMIAQHLVDNFDEVWYSVFCGKQYYESLPKRE